MPAPVVGAGAILLKALAWAVAAFFVALIANLPKMVAVAVAAYVFTSHGIGNSLVQALEYFFPTTGLDSDLSAYATYFGYAQAWFDVAFFLQLVVAYWTFVAVLGMTKMLMAFVGLGK